MSEQAQPTYVFPPALVTRADLARLVREVEDIDNELEAQKARNHASGKTGYHLPNLSQVLNDFLEANKINAADDQTRMALKESLRKLKDHAPIIHMTFAVEADPASLGQLMAYLRKEIHPQALISVGMQPALVGGVYVRTPNHVHDFSMRARLAESRGVITQDIEQFSNVIKVVEAPAEPAEVAAPAAPAPATATPAAAASQQPTQEHAAG